MKHYLLLLALLAAPAFARDDPGLFAIIQNNGVEVELYNEKAACAKGLLRAARFPIGQRSEYVMGCWRAESGMAVINFDDGRVLSFPRGAIIPARNIGNTL